MNNLSSKYTQEFSLAVINSFLKTLKQSILIVQGVIVCLCIIQFTRYRFVRLRSVLARCELLYVSTSHSLCQELFQVFQSFLSCRCAPGSSPFITQLCYYNTLFSFVKNFFQILSKFYFVLCGPRGQLAYISTPQSICQALFHKNPTSFLYAFTCAQSSAIRGIPPVWTGRC